MLKKNFWKERQTIYLSVFKQALPILQHKSSSRVIPYKNEDDISRDLSFAVQEVVFLINQATGKEYGIPYFQPQAQPSPSDKLKIKREDKRPDFLWGYVDYVNKQSLNYFVECKRLRPDLGHHCREYVVNGLKRFLDKEWSYGIYCESGLLIGYLEGVPVSDCISKIGSYLTESSVPSLVSVESKSGFEYLVHTIDRKEIPVSPIQMNHYLVVIN